MSPSEFNTLPLNERADLIWDRGKYSETLYVYGVHKIVIFTYSGFFVEIIYDISDHKIKDVIAMETTIDKEEIIKSIMAN